jgi:hypothetical protein
MENIRATRHVSAAARRSVWTTSGATAPTSATAVSGCRPSRPWQFGFFLEYDRGTEKPGQCAAKLATYYRYRDSGAYRRDYDGFPTLLVVTTSDAAEARFTHQAYLAQQRYGGMPLPMFLTTERRMQLHPEGPLGPIWRRPGPSWTAERSVRIGWLPGRTSRADAAYTQE